MSAWDFLPYFGDRTARSAGAFQEPAWLRRLRQHCAAADCVKRGKLWPAFLSPSRGVTLDGRWYCTSECMQSALIAQVRSLLVGSVRERPRRHRLPLGLLLVGRGTISQLQLREALHTQSQSGGEKLGHVLRQMGAIDSQELTSALGQQWNCPIFPLDRESVLLGCQDLVPLSVLESACAIPVFASLDGRTMHLAFGERLDHTTLYAVEQMLGCRTIACVAAEESVVGKLEQLRRSASREETSFDTMRDPLEITLTIRSYAGEYGASRIAIARASAYLWVRFASGRITRDLLFRIRSDADPQRFPSPGGAKDLTSSTDSRLDGFSGSTGRV